MLEKKSPMLFITLTLNPSMYVYKTNTQLLDTFYEVRHRLKDAVYYAVYELTEKGNIHYHILLLEYKKVTKPTKYWTQKFKHRRSEKLIFGFTSIKEVVSLSKVIEYCRKDISKTSASFKDAGLAVPRLLEFPIFHNLSKHFTSQEITDLGLSFDPIDQQKVDHIDASHLPSPSRQQRDILISLGDKHEAGESRPASQRSEKRTATHVECDSSMRRPSRLVITFE